MTDLFILLATEPLAQLAVVWGMVVVCFFATLHN